MRSGESSRQSRILQQDDTWCQSRPSLVMLANFLSGLGAANGSAALDIPFQVTQSGRIDYLEQGLALISQRKEVWVQTGAANLELGENIGGSLAVLGRTLCINFEYDQRQVSNLLLKMVSRLCLVCLKNGFKSSPLIFADLV